MRPHRRTPLAQFASWEYSLGRRSLMTTCTTRTPCLAHGQQPTSTPSAHAYRSEVLCSEYACNARCHGHAHGGDGSHDAPKQVEAMGRQMQEGSMQMHQQAMAMKTGDASAHQGHGHATMQHMQQMNEDMKHCEMQMQRLTPPCRRWIRAGWRYG